MPRSTALRALLLACALAGCAGTQPAHVGVGAPSLAPCPSSPNCVSSDADDPQHAVAALRFEGDAVAAWQRARRAVLTLSRTRIVGESPERLHAVCTSTLMRYRDDLELLLRLERSEIAVRSASRIGYGDMGANRARVEALRRAFEASQP